MAVIVPISSRPGDDVGLRDVRKTANGQIKVAGERHIALLRKKVATLLESGRYPNLSKIAKECNVSRYFVQNMLNTDIELRRKYEDALATTADNLEQTAIEFVENEEINPVARGKLMETMLRAHRPERYSDQASMIAAQQAGSTVKRITIIAEMPVVPVDKDGIPIPQDKDNNVIDV